MLPDQDFVKRLVEITHIKQLGEISKNFQILLSTIEVNDPNYLDFITTIATQISEDYVTITCARQLFTELILYTQGHVNDEMAIEGLRIVLAKIQPRFITFEDHIYDLRNYLAQRLEKSGDLLEAASVLAALPIENGQRNYDANNKINIYVKIAELYLKLEDVTNAESYANRASLIFYDCKDQELILRYKLVYAQLLDRKKKYLDAGQKYVELSTRVELVSENKRIEFLKHALASAILSAAGQQRSKLLTILYKDERFQALKEFSILEKLYLERLIDQNYLQMIFPLLKDQYGDIFERQGYKEAVWKGIVEKALVEHNMLAASVLYDNITFDNLGKLLGVTSTEAEKIAALMISEDRLCGTIDQIVGIVSFTKNNNPVLSAWSDSIANICNSVNNIVDKIENNYPEWYSQTIRLTNETAVSMEP